MVSGNNAYEIMSQCSNCTLECICYVRVGASSIADFIGGWGVQVATNLALPHTIQEQLLRACMYSLWLGGSTGVQYSYIV